MNEIFYNEMTIRFLGRKRNGIEREHKLILFKNVTDTELPLRKKCLGYDLKELLKNYSVEKEIKYSLLRYKLFNGNRIFTVNDFENGVLKNAAEILPKRQCSIYN